MQDCSIRKEDLNFLSSRIYAIYSSLDSQHTMAIFSEIYPFVFEILYLCRRFLQFVTTQKALYFINKSIL